MSIGLRGTEVASGIALSDEHGRAGRLPVERKRREKKMVETDGRRLRGEPFEGKESASERNDVTEVDSRCIGQTGAGEIPGAQEGRAARSHLMF